MHRYNTWFLLKELFTKVNQTQFCSSFLWFHERWEQVVSLFFLFPFFFPRSISMRLRTRTFRSSSHKSTVAGRGTKKAGKVISLVCSVPFRNGLTLFVAPVVQVYSFNLLVSKFTESLFAQSIIEYNLSRKILKIQSSFSF